MPWAKLDDQHHENEKVDSLSDAAFRLDVNGITYCARNLTDGFISEVRALALASRFHQPRRVINELVTKGRWEKREDGYEVHDFLIYNPSRSEVESSREQTRERVQRFRANKPKGPQGNGVTSDVTNTAPEPEPVPVPSSNGNIVDDVRAAREVSAAVVNDPEAISRVMAFHPDDRESEQGLRDYVSSMPGLPWMAIAQFTRQSNLYAWAKMAGSEKLKKLHRCGMVERNSIEERQKRAGNERPRLTVVSSQEAAAPSPDDMPGEHDEHPNVPDGTLPKRESEVWDRVQYGVLFQVGWKRWREQRWDLVDAAAWDEERRFLTLAPSPAMRRDRLYDDAMQVTLGGTFMGIRLHGIYWTDEAAAAS